MITELSGPVFSYGKYEGETIAKVVIMDPAYILWIVETQKDHGIPREFISEARSYVEHDPGDSDDYLVDYENYHE